MIPAAARAGSVPDLDTGGTTVGVLGQRWRATVRRDGTVAPWDGGAELSWYVAADDRWHVPGAEVSTRQTCVDGTPVVETRVRIPRGDAIQRVFAVADAGGLTIVQVENDSPLPIAVAFSGAAVRSARPAADVAIQGIDLPPGSVLFPVGHHATLTVALGHDGRSDTPLPAVVPDAAQVARGWLAVVQRAGRVSVPDAALEAAIVRARCELLLGGPSDPAVDPAGALLGIDQLVRMAGEADRWVPDVADAVHAVLRRRDADARDSLVALDAAARVLATAGERRAVRDLERARHGLQVPDVPAGITAPSPAPSPAFEGDAGRWLAATELRFVDGGALLPGGLPRAWWGQPVEVHGLPAGPASTVSFALRWHGARPAVLWEVTGAPVRLSAPVAAPGWSTEASRGEALWPAPGGEDASTPVEPVEPVEPVQRVEPVQPLAGDEHGSFS